MKKTLILAAVLLSTASFGQSIVDEVKDYNFEIEVPIAGDTVIYVQDDSEYDAFLAEVRQKGVFDESLESDWGMHSFYKKDGFLFMFTIANDDDKIVTISRPW